MNETEPTPHKKVVLAASHTYGLFLRLIGGVEGTASDVINFFMKPEKRIIDDEPHIGVKFTTTHDDGTIVEGSFAFPGNEKDLESGHKWFATPSDISRQKELNRAQGFRDLTSEEIAELGELDKLIFTDKAVVAGLAGATIIILGATLRFIRK